MAVKKHSAAPACCMNRSRINPNRFHAAISLGLCSKYLERAKAGVTNSVVGFPEEEAEVADREEVLWRLLRMSVNVFTA